MVCCLPKLWMGCSASSGILSFFAMKVAFSFLTHFLSDKLYDLKNIFIPAQADSLCSYGDFPSSTISLVCMRVMSMAAANKMSIPLQFPPSDAANQLWSLTCQSHSLSFVSSLGCWSFAGHLAEPVFTILVQDVPKQVKIGLHTAIQHVFQHFDWLLVQHPPCLSLICPWPINLIPFLLLLLFSSQAWHGS